MGGGLNTSEMFEKLESMREVVTEVNAQFKNPVSYITFSRCGPPFRSPGTVPPAGSHDFHPRHECVHFSARSSHETLTHTPLDEQSPSSCRCTRRSASSRSSRSTRLTCTPSLSTSCFSPTTVRWFTRAFFRNQDFDGISDHAGFVLCAQTRRASTARSDGVSSKSTSRRRTSSTAR